MLEETIKVVSLFKIIFPTKKKLWTRKLSKNCNNINKTDFSLGSKVCFLTQKHDGWSASWTTLFQYQQPKQFQKCKIYFSGTLATESDGRNAVPNKLSMITLWETNKYSNNYSLGFFITNKTYLYYYNKTISHVSPSCGVKELKNQKDKDY
jgi:hypothetical protein